jgi:hypothetical protein
MKMRLLLIFLVITSLVITAQRVDADDSRVNAVQIRFEMHRFDPASIQIRAGVPTVLTVVNAGKERIEFESFKLRREKVVEPGQTIVIRLPALPAGSYDFFDDFHGDVPEGEIVAK